MGFRIYSAIAFAMWGALLTGAACAAGIGDGQVTFDGSIADTPCSIAPGSRAREVDMGATRLVELFENGKSEKVPFELKLVDCNVGEVTLAYITFTGVESDMGGYSFGMSSGTAKNVAMNLWLMGTAVKPGSLYTFYYDQGEAIDGSLIVPLTAALQGSDESTPGDFASIVYFTIDY